MISSAKRCSLSKILAAAVLFAVAAFGPVIAAAPLKPEFEQALRAAPPDSAITVLVAPSLSFDLIDLENQLRRGRATRKERHRRVVETLKLESARSQATLINFLNTEHSKGKVKSYRPFWIANIVAVTTTASRVAELAARPDVWRVLENRRIYLNSVKVKSKAEPVSAAGDGTTLAEDGKIFNWALANMNVRPLWQRGLTGRGILVGNIDSGVDGTHPALAAKWRGANGATVTESWFDAIDGSTFPFDDNPITHGTGTMGCMVAQSGADTIGVVPDAQWIAAKAFDVNSGDPETVLRCMEWMADPDLDPATVDDVPDILNLSFADPASEGCSEYYWTALDNLKLLGVVPILAAGNYGAGSGAHGFKVAPPANSPNYFAVTSVDSLWQWASESMPGPSLCDPNVIKPDIVAPGHQIITTNGTQFSSLLYRNITGSSFACPLAAGVAALVRQANPELTPDEVYDILRSSATDLGVAGPDTLFGYGAINADSAVALAGSPTRPWLTITGIELAAGADGLVSPGEQIGVVLTLTNNGLSAGSVSATVTSNSIDVTVTSGAVSYGSISNGGSGNNASSPFALSFSQSIPLAEIRTFDVNLAIGEYSQILAFAIDVGGEPPTPVETFATHDINKAGLSITNYGTVGVDDNDGGGFVYPRTSALRPDHLFQGGLMIANSPNTVSDASYRDNGVINFNRDFNAVTGGNLEIFQPGGYADQEIHGVYADSNADVPLGVVVSQRSYGWAGSADEDFIIVEYSLAGAADSALKGLMVAQHIDWDVNSDNDNDFGAYERENALMYMFDGSSDYYVGNVLLTQGVGGARILNFYDDIADGFSGQEKWAAMISNPWKDTVSAAVGDYSQILSAGPVYLKPQQELVVAFAIVGGEGLDDLRANAAAARVKWAEVAAVRGLDTTPPSLAVTPMRNQAPERQNYQLLLSATDSVSSVEEVRVYWRDFSPQLTGWVWVTAGAVDDSGNMAALLPKRPEGTRVQYYVQAIDTQGNQAIRPEKVPDEYFSFYVGDTTRPLISSTALSGSPDGSGMLIIATVTDTDLGTVAAILLTGPQAADTLLMSPSGDDNSFSAVVSGLEPDAEVGYFVEATDTLGNFARYPADAPDELLQLVFRPVLAGDGDLNGKVDIFDLLAMLKVISGRQSPTDSERLAMDLDINGKVNIFDLLELLKLLKN
ncbi:MAG: S8 family serine peptidase [Candidatus Glassbacteria bacterium]|nr:S8 family serine peptidase [Candidatus Glassbacteria bacterium]